MLKVLQINKLFHPWIGGVETVVKQLADGFKNDDHFTVDVLAGNENKSNNRITSTDLGYKVYKATSAGIKFSTPISADYVRVFRKLINEYDIFHFHVPNPLGELSHFLSSIPKHKKVIVTFHADVAKTRWSFLYLPYSILLHKLLRRADVIVSTAPDNLANLKILQAYKEKCKVIPLGYDPIPEKPIEESVRHNFRSTFNLKDKKTLLFIGRLGYYKGIDILIKAIEKIDVQLIIVGEGKLRQELEELASRLNISEKVIFTGFLSREDLFASYMLADVFVLPSVSEAEAFGLVQLEAMHFGVPVINTSLPTGVPYVSLNGITGLTVTPSSVKELSSAIEKIISNDQLRNEFSINAKQRAKEFTIEVMIKAYKNLYAA